MESKFGAEYHRNYYKKRRQAIFEYLGGKCVVCGTTEKLEVDHIHREQKSFHISSRMSVKNNKKELDKCQLLCQEHHRQKTGVEQAGWTHGTTYGWMRKHCKCNLCLSEKVAWSERRNAKRRKA